jgi:hypothetical protein
LRNLFQRAQTPQHVEHFSIMMLPSLIMMTIIKLVPVLQNAS